MSTFYLWTIINVLRSSMQIAMCIDQYYYSIIHEQKERGERNKKQRVESKTRRNRETDWEDGRRCSRGDDCARYTDARGWLKGPTREQRQQGTRKEGAGDVYVCKRVKRSGREGWRGCEGGETEVEKKADFKGDNDLCLR